MLDVTISRLNPSENAQRPSNNLYTVGVKPMNHYFAPTQLIYDHREVVLSHSLNDQIYTFEYLL